MSTTYTATEQFCAHDGAARHLSVIEQFMAATREHSIDIDESIIADGKLHRYHVAGDKKRTRNGWAVLHIDEHPAGKFGSWKTGQKFTWTMKESRPLTDDERHEIREKARARAAQRQAETEMNQANAAQRALAIYDEAQPVTEHPYLTLKGVPSSPRLRIGNWYRIDEDTGEEILVSSSALIVPMLDPGKRVHSLQAILDDGEGGFRKQYLKDGAKKAKFLSIGKPRDNTILICEGLATGLSLWQCTAHAVLVAFDAGNLIHVAREARSLFATALLLLCADNDAWTHEPIENPGLRHAREAAAAVNGIVAYPEFLNTETRPTDFNDLHQLEGDETVRTVIHRALVPPVEAPETASNDEPIPTAEARADEQLVAQLLDTDIANAQRLAACYGQDLRFTVERGWMVWDGRRWAIDEKDVQIQARAKKTARAIFDEIKDAPDRDARMTHAKKSHSKRAIEAMMWLARSESGIPARLTNFDSDGWLLNVANGTIDLRTGVLRDHRREDLISNLVNIAFDPDAECERWDGFLWRVTDHNEELYCYLRRFVGYLLVGDTSDQSLHFLYGLGANGKSVFCEVLMQLLGEYAITVSPDLIMLRRHGGIPNDVARLRGVRAALMNETAQGARFDEAKLKDLTGGDTLTARFLHQEFFDFRPTHRIVIRGNHKPAINGTDEGIWRRLRLVPFTVTIPKDERDPYLQQKLNSELSGILNWALRGCREWQEQGLVPPSIITDAVQAYRSESDTLGRFIEECCEMRSLAEVKSSALYKSYQAFAEAAGERWIPSKDFPTELERRGFKWKRKTAGVLFLGIELRNSGGHLEGYQGWTT